MLKAFIKGNLSTKLLIAGVVVGGIAWIAMFLRMWIPWFIDSFMVLWSWEADQQFVDRGGKFWALVIPGSFLLAMIWCGFLIYDDKNRYKQQHRNFDTARNGEQREYRI